MLREYLLIKIHEDGVIKIPQELAYEVGLVKGAYFLVEIDTDIKELHVERVALPGKKLVEIELVVEDKPGVLAKIAGILGKNGINILFNEAEELESLGLSAIVAVVDVSGAKISLKDLESTLKEINEVKEVKIVEIE